jgi:hypothetical protein
MMSVPITRHNTHIQDSSILSDDQRQRLLEDASVELLTRKDIEKVFHVGKRQANLKIAAIIVPKHKRALHHQRAVELTNSSIIKRYRQTYGNPTDSESQDVLAVDEILVNDEAIGNQQEQESPQG